MRRVLGIIFFLVILAGILYLANLAVYNALVVVFPLSSAWEMRALGLMLGILSVSFIVAMLLGMRYYNRFTRWYYTLSAVWMGFFVYLFLASVIFGLLAMVIGTPLTRLGQLLVIGAVLAGAYGIRHARKLHITETEVSLAHLPAVWSGRKAIWISDLHLGQLHGPAFARRVVEKINTLPHDIVFIGGDLFDGTGAPDIQELVEPLKDLSAPLGVYFVTGNHEGFGDSNRFTNAIQSAGARVLRDEIINLDGVQLVGVDYHNASHAEGFGAILAKLAIDTKMPAILLKHEPKDLDIAQAAGISLQISGHTHRAQQWPLEYVARLVYKGFVYGLKSFKTMQVYVSSGVGTWGPPIRVGTDSEIVVFTFNRAEN